MRRLSPLHPLVLASSSPQRKAILERLVVVFTVRPPNVAEIERGDPTEVAAENALRKARAAQDEGERQRKRDEELVGEGMREQKQDEELVREGVQETVLGVDTLVTLGGIIYGKPANELHARETLRALSGATHRVVSGLALLLPEGAERTAVAQTEVTFRTLDERLLDWYVASGEWRGRAGGYAIQGAGAALVRAIEGDYENVVGLPVTALLDLYPELLEGP